MVRYPIAEIFYSVQGEGVHAGSPAVFVRLSGCNAGCKFCDTNHDPQMWLSEAEIGEHVAELVGNRKPMIVITGGEPTIHDLGPLTGELGYIRRYYIALETNGINEPRGYIHWVAVSPKRPYAPGHSYHPSEFKFIMTADGWLVDPTPFLAAYPNVEAAFIQPVWGSPQAFALAIQKAKENPSTWRLGTQTQKYLKLR